MNTFAAVRTALLCLTLAASLGLPAHADPVDLAPGEKGKE